MNLQNQDLMNDPNHMTFGMSVPLSNDEQNYRNQLFPDMFKDNNKQIKEEKSKTTKNTKEPKKRGYSADNIAVKNLIAYDLLEIANLSNISFARSGMEYNSIDKIKSWMSNHVDTAIMTESTMGTITGILLTLKVLSDRLTVRSRLAILEMFSNDLKKTKHIYYKICNILNHRNIGLEPAIMIMPVSRQQKDEVLSIYRAWTTDQKAEKIVDTILDIPTIITKPKNTEYADLQNRISGLEKSKEIITKNLEKEQNKIKEFKADAQKYKDLYIDATKNVSHHENEAAYYKSSIRKSNIDLEQAKNDLSHYMALNNIQ